MPNIKTTIVRNICKCLRSSGQRSKEKRSEFLRRIVTDVCRLPDEIYFSERALYEESRQWVEESAERIKARLPVIDPETGQEVEGDAGGASPAEDLDIEPPAPEPAPEPPKPELPPPGVKLPPPVLVKLPSGSYFRKRRDIRHVRQPEDYFKPTTKGEALKFREVVVKAIAAGMNPTPVTIINALGLHISRQYAAQIVWEVRQTMLVLQAADMLSSRVVAKIARKSVPDQ